MTAAITAITGFQSGFYEAPVGKFVGQVGGFVAAALIEPFAFLDQQVIFANSDAATRGWEIVLNNTTIEARIFHDGPGSISATHTLTAGDLGRLLLPVLLFTGADLALIVNGSLVNVTSLPGGTAYLSATTQASLGAGAGGGTPFGGGVVGAAYSDQVFTPELFRAHWASCQSARDMIDGALGSLLGSLVMPTFQHLYSARRSNNGGPGNVPGAFPFLAAGAVWPDDRGTGGAVNFSAQGLDLPFVITVRDGI